jgi:WhiB family redox-sensing transcriptional regulator
MPATVFRPVGTSWMAEAGCRGATHIFFAQPGERSQPREVREAEARAMCHTCSVMSPCRTWAREHREYGFWGGESEEERAAAGFRVEMPVGRIARYPEGEGKPVQALGVAFGLAALVAQVVFVGLAVDVRTRRSRSMWWISGWSTRATPSPSPTAATASRSRCP